MEKLNVGTCHSELDDLNFQALMTTMGAIAPENDMRKSH